MFIEKGRVDHFHVAHVGRPVDASTGPNRIGFFCAIIAYLIWGVFPLFWRQLADVPALELVCHRVIWSTLFLLAAIGLLRSTGTKLAAELTGRRTGRRTGGGGEGVGQAVGVIGAQSKLGLWLLCCGSAVAISINWLSFVWAVNNGRILDSSLGYYIAPLASVGLGVVVMNDRLSRSQWISIAIAAVGVLAIAAGHGSVPWVSIAMALSFAIYGLLKKRTAIPPLVGLLMENAILAIPATVYLLLVSRSGASSMGQLGRSIDILIVMGGVITVPPLMLFAIAARRVALSTIGMLQYIGPTLQFFIGVEVAGESLTTGRLAGFVLVWIGSGFYIYAIQSGTRMTIPPASYERGFDAT